MKTGFIFLSGNPDRSRKAKAFLFRFLAAAILAFAAWLPFLNGSIVMGSDTAFHLNRIEALYTAFSNHDYFPGIFWEQNYGWGYGSPLFYSSFFLSIPAWFRMNGMSMMDAYRLFCYLIFFASAWTMYGCAETVIRKNRLSYVLTAALYLFCTYCWSDLYNRGAVGEALAGIFIPLVLQASYTLFYRGQKGWLRLAFGFAGLLLSHNISFFLTLIYFVIFCLLHIRRLIRHPKILVKILCAGILGFLLTAWFSLPMLQQLNTGLYRISTYFNQGESLQSLGNTLTGLLTLLPFDHDHLTATCGVCLLLMPVLVFFTPKRKGSRYIRIIAISGYVMLAMTLKYFPWVLFPFMSFMQFPHRFFTISAPFLALASGYGFAWYPFPAADARNIRLSITGAAVILMLLQVNSQYSYGGSFTDATTPDQLKTNDAFAYNVDNAWYSIMELSTPDYLPSDKSIVYSEDKRTIVHGDMTDSVFDETYNSLAWHYDGGGIYRFPKTWYDGFAVTVEKGDTILYQTTETSADPDTGEVVFELPDGLDSESTIVLSYEGTSLRKNMIRLSRLTLYVFVFCDAAYQIARSIRRKKGAAK